MDLSSVNLVFVGFGNEDDEGTAWEGCHCLRTKLVAYRGSGRWGRLLDAACGGKQMAAITAARRGDRSHLVELDRTHARVNGSGGLLRVEMCGTVS